LNLEAARGEIDRVSAGGSELAGELGMDTLGHSHLGEEMAGRPLGPLNGAPPEGMVRRARASGRRGLGMVRGDREQGPEPRSRSAMDQGTPPTIVEKLVQEVRKMLVRAYRGCPRDEELSGLRIEVCFQRRASLGGRAGMGAGRTLEADAPTDQT